MKFLKTISFIASSFAVLAVAMTPLQASALSTASMTLAGATQSNGSFSVVVYEDTGSDTVTGANVEVSGVSGVSYDYSVGPFTAVTPSGAHNAYGTVSGSNPVARISFTLSTPSTVTVSINGNSYLKHAGDTSVESFAINRGSANFTYTAPSAPATGGQGGGSNTGSSNPTSNASTSSTPTNSTPKANTGSTNNSTTAATTGETKDATTAATTDNGKKTDPAKKADPKTTEKKSGSKAWLWILLIAIAAAAAAYVVRKKQVAQAQAQAAEAAAAEKAKDNKKNTKKNVKKASKK